jgi:hypothetical protein
MFRSRIAILALLALSSSLAFTQNHNNVEINRQIHSDVSVPLRDMAPAPRREGPREAEPIRRIPSNRKHTDQPDTALQSTFGGATNGAVSINVPATTINIDGVGNGLAGFSVNSAPPDTNGSVGSTQYVQTVNTDFAVFNKSNGALVFGPVPINTLWSGFGGGCQTNNDGDPTVVYDKIANRWIIAQFSVNTTPFLQCVAVSQTSDATGSYFRYSFSYSTQFPDYPKMGVWPDGYYTTYNMFNSAGTSFLGAKVCAFDRAKMLTGAVATQQCFNTSTSFGGLLPADLDGSTLPPAGAPNYVVALGATSGLAVWKFHVDWTTPANSTFTGPTSLATAAYTELCNGGTCVPQSGTTRTLDSLADRIMNRAAYRNFGDHEAIVFNHSIVAGSSGGVRWYELRNLSATPTLFQQGTYAPDASYRWMGSIAMDKVGNMGLGYSVSSSSLHPEIRYTGRLAGDPAGQMTQGEATIFAGAGSQTGTLTRWGDYSSMSIDPADDCTFWYTTEYIPANGTFNWRTRIASFTFPSCVNNGPDFALGATPASQSVTQGGATSYTVTETPQNGFTGSVTLSLSGLPAGASASFTPNPTTGTSTLNVSTGTAVAGSYALTITGISGALTHTAGVTLNITGPPDFSVSATPATRSVATGSTTTYTATETPLNGFSGSVTFTVTGVPSGASASFSPNPTSGSSTLTVNTGTAALGTYTLTITGTSGTLTHSTTVTLTITAAQGFTISSTPTSRTVVRKNSTTYAISISRIGGFTGSVNFSLTGVPSRVTASFSPSSTTGTSSTLTISTRNNSPRGTFNMTVTGTSGTTNSSVPITLIIQ